MNRAYSLLLLCVIALSGCAGSHRITPRSNGAVRFAVFNIKELSTTILSETDAAGHGSNTQVLDAAKVIQTARPDVLIVLEIDHDYTDGHGDDLTLNAHRLIDNYLDQGENPISYKYVFVAPNNTGQVSGLDLDNDGTVAADDSTGRPRGNDSWGYGNYRGQYSMAVLSRYPIDADDARTFQKFLWKDLPGNHIPPGYFSARAENALRLSSKSHWDVPLEINGHTVHFLVSHPTPPGFDGPEDKNGRRNFDEIMFWRYYLADDSRLYDDKGVHGGLPAGESFVIAGDMNAMPRTEPRYDNQFAIDQLLVDPRLQDTSTITTSKGGLRGRPAGPPKYFERHSFGYGDDTLQIDYLLPSRDLRVLDAAIYWPSVDEDPVANKIAEEASDHRLVWLDVLIQEVQP